MRLNRFAVAAALAASVLVLTACDPEAPEAAPAPGSTAPSASAAAPSSTAAAPSSAKPTGGAGATKKPGTGKTSAPAADCTANAAAVGTVVEAVDGDYSNDMKITVTLRSTKFVCGPDVPGDGHFEATGSPKVYGFASGGEGYLLNGTTPEQASVDYIAKFVKDCAKNPNSAPQPYHCNGRQFTIEADAQGNLTKITQLYRA
ncbi:hypothetical protein [Kitasatospora phosalacinea]|uniref:Lipoprotein n=1 Tax=Kitasatospora phosalacinea TaxID=2065 RepID=A0ABW6GPQ8_9ACTN